MKSKTGQSPSAWRMMMSEKLAEVPTQQSTATGLADRIPRYALRANGLTLPVCWIGTVSSRMSTADDFFLTNRDDQRPIHSQCRYGGTARRCKRHDAVFFPPKVFVPTIRPRIEKRGFLVQIRIRRRPSGTFT